MILKKRQPLNQLGIEGTHLKLIKPISPKPTANIHFMGAIRSVPTKVRNQIRLPIITPTVQNPAGGPR